MTIGLSRAAGFITLTGASSRESAMSCSDPPRVGFQIRSTGISFLTSKTATILHPIPPSRRRDMTVIWMPVQFLLSPEPPGTISRVARKERHRNESPQGISRKIFCGSLFNRLLNNLPTKCETEISTRGKQSGSDADHDSKGVGLPRVCRILFGATEFACPGAELKSDHN